MSIVVLALILMLSALMESFSLAVISILPSIVEIETPDSPDIGGFQIAQMLGPAPSLANLPMPTISLVVLSANHSLVPLLVSSNTMRWPHRLRKPRKLLAPSSLGSGEK